MATTLAYWLLWLVAVEYAAVGGACFADANYPLAGVFLSFSLSNVCLALVGGAK